MMLLMLLHEEKVFHAPLDEFLAYMKTEVHRGDIHPALRTRLYEFAEARNEKAHATRSSVSYLRLDWDPDTEEWDAWVERMKTQQVLEKLK